MQHVQTATVGDRDDVHNRIHNFGLGVLAMLFFGFGSIMTFYFTAAVLIYTSCSSVASNTDMHF